MLDTCRDESILCREDRVTWEAILEPKGWTKGFTKPGRQFWLPPSIARCPVAHPYTCVVVASQGGVERFFCNSDGFPMPADTGLSKFAVWAYLEGSQPNAKGAAAFKEWYSRALPVAEDVEKMIEGADGCFLPEDLLSRIDEIVDQTIVTPRTLSGECSYRDPHLAIKYQWLSFVAPDAEPGQILLSLRIELIGLKIAAQLQIHAMAQLELHLAGSLAHKLCLGAEHHLTHSSTFTAALLDWADVVRVPA